MEKNRVVKFRAWDTVYKKMSSDEWIGHYDDLYISNINEILNENICFVWMQYTGLKDANGKEIYEGDVAKIKIKINGILFDYIGVMEFKEGSFMFRYESEFYPENEIVDSPEVIGNIYENFKFKDLIKQN